MYRIILLLIFAIAFSSSIYAEPKNETLAFKSGERLTYKAFYNWGLLWVYAAEVELKITEKSFASKPSYLLEAKATSFNRYDWLFKVNDTFKTHVSMDAFQPLWSERNTSEGHIKVFESYHFKYPENLVYSLINSKVKPFVKDTFGYVANSFDVLSAVYNCRNLNFDRCKINDKIPVKLILDGKINSVFIRYLGKELIENRKGQRFKCIKFTALLMAGTAFKGGEDVSVWVTDDENRIPILVEAKILIGSVKAFVEISEGLKYPMNALLKK